MDVLTLGAALKIVEKMVPGLEGAAQGANLAANAALEAAANAGKNDKALNQFIVTVYWILRKQQEEIEGLKSSLNALTN